MGTQHTSTAPDELTAWMQAASDHDATAMPWRAVGVIAALLALAAVVL